MRKDEEREVPDPWESIEEVLEVGVRQSLRDFDTTLRDFRLLHIFVGGGPFFVDCCNFLVAFW